MIYESNYLEHHGIKGQKWGLRRFQNEDGSYTPEGKERYGVKSEKSESGAVNHPVGGSGGRTGSMPRGMAGGINIDPGLKSAATVIGLKMAHYQHRKINAKKEIADAHINDEKERISKKDLKHMCQKYTRKDRQRIINSMKDDKSLSYDDARKPVDKDISRRAARNTAIIIAANLAIPLVMMYGHGLKNKAHDALGRSKMFQEFARSMKHRKMKDAVVLRPDEYEIDKQWKLPSGRG